MANVFDFTLRGNDEASEAIKKINDEVQKLKPALDETGDKLGLGGQGTHDGLSDIEKAFEQLGKFAKQNVQFIGDMVPPLKNFTGMAGKVSGLIGGLGVAGGAAYLAGKGIQTMGSDLADASKNAYGLQVAAENAGMSVNEFSRMTGAMQLLGSDADSAQQSVEGLYKTFNDAAQGRNNTVLSLMNQIGAVIARNADGTANVTKTVESLATIIPTLSPQVQKTVADSLGLDANGLQLLREGVRLKSLLTESDAVGLTIDPKTNADLAAFNQQLNEASAAWDGFKKRTEQKTMKFLMSDGSMSDTVAGFTDGLAHNDMPGWGHMLGLNDGPYEAAALRKMKADKKFMSTLTPVESANVDIGRMSGGLRKKYNAYYGENLTDGWQLDKERAQNPDYFKRLNFQSNQLTADMSAATHPVAAGSPVPSHSVNMNAPSVRNNNPWNIRYAGQQGAVASADNFAQFATPEDGVLAAQRQLMLYASGKSNAAHHVPLTTLSQIISTASPTKDGNNTPLMIANASKELNVAPNQQLDLSNIDERARVMTALFNQEGNNRYNADQIKSIIQREPQPPLMPVSGQQSLTNPVMQPPLIRSPQLPAYSLPPASQANGSAQDIATAVASALKETGFKVELTLIDSKTGQRSTVIGTGSKVSTAMEFPR